MVTNNSSSRISVAVLIQVITETIVSLSMAFTADGKR